ncbi:hypothetical protein CALCODRAFT_508896 [Calocera cornea HHB12733]|uniref:Uncharacterized protein n=1 Tax=Calocera cornea HHB12733 TaxID=1353952 RepID=A0A165FXK2_9BASI|nr:hypothetical protein CALCODRAFT_508896 [Calocera cornea HHB12733]
MPVRKQGARYLSYATAVRDVEIVLNDEEDELAFGDAIRRLNSLSTLSQHSTIFSNSIAISITTSSPWGLTPSTYFINSRTRVVGLQMTYSERIYPATWQDPLRYFVLGVETVAPASSYHVTLPSVYFNRKIAKVLGRMKSLCTLAIRDNVLVRHKALDRPAMDDRPIWLPSVKQMKICASLTATANILMQINVRPVSARIYGHMDDNLLSIEGHVKYIINWLSHSSRNLQDLRLAIERTGEEEVPTFDTIWLMPLQACIRMKRFWFGWLADGPICVNGAILQEMTAKWADLRDFSYWWSYSCSPFREQLEAESTGNTRGRVIATGGLSITCLAEIANKCPKLKIISVTEVNLAEENLHPKLPISRDRTLQIVTQKVLFKSQTFALNVLRGWNGLRVRTLPLIGQEDRWEEVVLRARRGSGLSE